MADALLHLATIVYSLPTLNIISKPLLMVFLMAYFVSLVGNHNNKLKLIIIIALVCSWFGDTFLMFQNNNPTFFILGLGAFLLTHIAYIFAFYKLPSKASLKFSVITSSVFLIYSIGLAYLLWPGLGSMKIPVVAYAIVLTAMGIYGIIKNIGASNLIMAGTILFIISDSLIAYTKFVEPLTNSSFFIMSTYITAQYLLVKGLSNRINKVPLKCQ